MNSFSRKREISKINRKFLVFLIFLLSITCSTINAQGLKKDNITINIKNERVTETFKKVSQLSNYKFFYDENLVKNLAPISINRKNTSLQNILNDLTNQTGLIFIISDNTITVSKKSTPNQASTSKIEVKGIVKDLKGEPLIGVTITEKGQQNGTATDLDGKFSLKVSSNATLVLTYVGYEKKELKATTEEIVVTLHEDFKVLDEIVVVGYGTERRSLVTSAISKLTIDESTLRQTPSPAQLLDGRIAGVTVSSGSGNLGSGERISIRGSSSINAGNDPLYVIDGIPITNPDANLYNFGETMSSLATLNLADIESIEILKDAASAAIYGSRATNGVVVITTKSGKEGRSDISLNVSAGISQFRNLNRVKTADSKRYLEAYNEGVDNYNRQYDLNVGDTNYQTYLHNPFGHLADTNWMDLILQTGSFYNIDMSFSGGTKKTKFYVGANYNDMEGIIKTNKLTKINLKAKISHELTPWLEIGANTSGGYNKNHQVPGANAGTTIINRAILQRPFDRPFKPNGDYYVGGTDQLIYHNPVQILDEQVAFIENMRFLGNYYGMLKYKDKLSWKYSFSADIMQTYDYTYYNENHPYGTGKGRLLDYNRTVRNLLSENVLSYKDNFKDFSLSAILGHSYQQIMQRQTGIDGRGFPSPSFDVAEVASEIASATAGEVGQKMASYFGRATLAYKDRYIFTGTLRTDGSSKFAKENRWGWFPSVSLGWNMSEESFMKDSDIEVKLRASYGKTGNQEGIGRYAYQSLLNGGLNYNNQSGIGVSSFGNYDLTWETADQYDFGFDVSFLKGKINAMLDIYQKDTKDLLYNRPVHATTGTTSILSNIGSMRNRGVEFTLNTHFTFGKFEWLSQFNIGHNKNKITALLDNDDRPISIGNNRALQVGKELGAFYIFKQDGIYQFDGEVPAELYDRGVRAGDVKWYDADNNNLINDNDRVVMGSSNPDFSGGFNNTFRYNGFQLDAFFTYMYGNDVLAQWQTDLSKVGHRNAIVTKYIDNRWTGPGSTNKYPRAMNNDTNNTKNSDRLLEDGSFIRLRSLTLSYTLPTIFCSKINLKGVRVYFQADNVFLLTKYSGWDPEINSNLDPRYMGVDTFGVPQPRSFSIGFNLSL